MPPTALLTRHALYRSRTRQIPSRAIEAALCYGRVGHRRGAEIFTLGWREVRYWAERGIELSRFEGVEVVCTHGGHVITVYRNHKPYAVRDRAWRRTA